MKKLFAILAVTAATVFVTGCTDDDLMRKRVIDNIAILPGEWKEYTIVDDFGDELFDHFYVDVALPELTHEAFNNGFFYTYWKYQDGQVLIQEGEGVTMHLDGYDENGEWFAYSEIISCSYDVGSMRIMISRSDFRHVRPDKILSFRTVILY